MADEPTRRNDATSIPEPDTREPASDVAADPLSAIVDAELRARAELAAAAAVAAAGDDRAATERSDRGGADRGITDFVRRAVSAGVGAASRSKDDIMRAAAVEVRNWLEHLNLNEEVAKALSRMVIEVKTEIRFRPQEDGKVVTEATRDVKVKGKP